MNYGEMQGILSQMLQVQRQMQESQLKHETEISDLRAIANSNARAIEATANEGNETKQDLRRLVNIVATFVEATNTRLQSIEDRN